MQQLAQPPPMVRTADGRMVPAQTDFNPKPKTRRFLLVLQYWAGDQADAEELGDLIADLERIRNRDVDVLIFARADAPEFSPTIRQKLEGKFGKVTFLRCRRRDAKSYPFAANAMFSDMVTLFSQYQPWSTDYFAFINLEADCCPLRPGWIGELVKAYREADMNGYSATGFIHDNPVRHMNGVAIYAIDIWKRVGSAKLSGGNPQVAYDIYHSRNLMPHCTHTELIRFAYRLPTITADDLFCDHEPSPPAVYHGVKDNSAREAVRARFITFSERRDTSRKTVFTFSNPNPAANRMDEEALIRLWIDGWKSRGWNPIVLTMREARRHSKFPQMVEAVKKFPHTGDAQAASNRFLRWLALDVMGGGFMVERTVLPDNFTPEELNREATVVMNDPEPGAIVVAYLDKAAAVRFVDHILAFDPDPNSPEVTAQYPDVSDLTAWKTFGQFTNIVQENSDIMLSPKMVWFTPESVGSEKVATAMERFLRTT